MYYLYNNKGQLIESSISRMDLELVKEADFQIFDSYPPQGVVFENGTCRSKTIREKILDSEISLIERRIQIKEEIKKYLDEKLELGIEFLSSPFQCRETDINRMNHLLKKIELGGGWDGSWRDKLNRWQQLSTSEFKQLVLSAMEYKDKCFLTATELIDELPTLSKPALADYNVGSRWGKT